ncbi:hypothetical protein BH23VER1_BH23VER1_24480 [soil metagenome]
MKFTFGCFVCGKGNGEKISDTCCECGSSFDIGAELPGKTLDRYHLVEPLGRGHYGIVFKAKNRIEKPFALKICSATLYDKKGKSFYQEIRRYNDVGEHANIAQLIDAGEGTLSILGQEQRVYYLSTQYFADAETLEEFIGRDEFATEDIIGVATQLCSAAARLEEAGLMHNDLHARNILVAPRPGDDFDHHPASTRHHVKIVDMGSSILRYSDERKPKSDAYWIANHIANMASSLRRRNGDELTIDSWFLRRIPEILQDIIDEDPSRSDHSAFNLQTRVEALWKRSSRRSTWRPIRLDDPFDYINANNFPDEAYIPALFSDKFTWHSSIKTSENTQLITGPRGCGKTMMLRSMRLRSLLAKISEDDSEIKIVQRVEKSPMIGFFLSARLAISLHRFEAATPKWLSTPGAAKYFYNKSWTYGNYSAMGYGCPRPLPVRVQPK